MRTVKRWMVKCWICGKDIHKKETSKACYGELRLVSVHSPGPNTRTGAVYICQECLEKKCGLASMPRP